MTRTALSPEPYVRALQFAASAHGGQTVPGTDHPYLVHVCSVAAEVIAALEIEPHADPDLAIACALLHDVVEDTGVTVAAVERTFGARVAAGVSALTKDKKGAKDARMRSSLDRIRLQPREVWMVKLADRITNLQPPPKNWNREKCRMYRVEAETIADELGDASAVLVARLRARIDGYRRYGA
ncbi:MAG TPA: HD domain-containing protein [Vicinamibacterales bacterium]|nr:HD domain-containing protein [Vicinamibacterales bacterium]